MRAGIDKMMEGTMTYRPRTSNRGLRSTLKRKARLWCLGLSLLALIMLFAGRPGPGERRRVLEFGPERPERDCRDDRPACGVAGPSAGARRFRGAAAAPDDGSAGTGGELAR